MVYFPGCPGAKKTEFLTSVLDALSTDMVHAVTDPASAGRYDNIQWVNRPPTLNTAIKLHEVICNWKKWPHSDEMIHWCVLQDGRAGSQPHPGGKGGPLVLQPAWQKLKRGHWEEGDQTLQTLSAQEIQAKEMCEEVCGVLWHQQRQGHLSAGADGLPGRDQRRRWHEQPNMIFAYVFTNVFTCTRLVASVDKTALHLIRFVVYFFCFVTIEGTSIDF